MSRVLIFSEWYPSPSRPVAGSFVREHARALAGEHEVAVVYLDPDGASGEEDADGVRTVRVPRPDSRLPGVTTPQRWRALGRALRRLEHDGFRPDVLHAHVYSAGAAAAVLNLRRRLPLVVSEHYSGFSLRTVSARELRKARFAFARADVVCPPSESLARDLRELGLPGPFRPVPNPVDTSLFAPPPSRKRRGRLLVVALLEEVKGVRFAVQALAELGGEAVLRIAGDGSQRAGLEALVRDLGLADRVRFLGLLDRRDVAQEMRAADLLVVPSLHETLGTVIVEATATGLPVVASDVGGVPEVADEESSALVPAGDPSAIADAVRALLRARAPDPEAMAHRAAQRFGPQAIAARWSEVYSEAERLRRR